MPYTASDSAIAKTHAAINTLYRSMSRNTFEFEFKVHPEVWTAPGTGASYVSNFSSLQNFINTKMKEAGYVKGSNYTVFVASLPPHRPGLGRTFQRARQRRQLHQRLLQQRRHRP